MADVTVTARLQGIQQVHAGFSSIQSQLFSLQSAFVAAGGTLLARSFVDAGKKAEGFRLRLTQLLGSTEEGARAFKKMSEFAATVPFQFEEIMASATQLSATAKDGVDEIAGLMPIIGDLSASFGLSFRETTNQVQRMLTAGAAAADQFRERGVLAALGFQQGVSYSAAQTRQMLIKAFEDPASKFRGTSAKLASTWDGIMSMMQDKFFQFRLAVMDAGLFSFLKANLIVINEMLTDTFNPDRAKAWSESGINAIRKFVAFVGMMADGLHGINILWNMIKTTIAGISNLIIQSVGVAVNYVVGTLVPAMLDALAGLVRRIPKIGAELARGMEGFATKLRANGAAFEEFAISYGHTTQEVIDSTKNLLMERLPSEGIDEYMARVEKTFAELEKKYKEMFNRDKDGDDKTIDPARAALDKYAKSLKEAALEESILLDKVILLKDGITDGTISLELYDVEMKKLGFRADENKDKIKTFADAFKEAHKDMQEESYRLGVFLARTYEEMKIGGLDMIEGIHGAIQQGFSDILTGTESFGEALKNMMRNIVNAILNDIARAMASAVTQVVFGGKEGMTEFGKTILGGIFGTGSGGGNEQEVTADKTREMGHEAERAAEITRGSSVAVLENTGMVRESTSVMDKFKAATGIGIEGLIGFAAFLSSFSGKSKKGGLLGAAAGFALGSLVPGLNPITSAYIGGVLGSGMQHGGSRVVTRPELIPVGEVGPERISVQPLTGRRSMSSGAVYQFNGPVYLDEVTYRQFARQQHAAIRREERRYG